MVKVSIIVPVFNTERYLKQCFDSLLNQSFKDIEIIIVNDGSSDNSIDIIKKYSKIDDRIVVINKKNEGTSVARNLGIKKAKGDYIMFVDSDDYISTNAIKILYNNALKTNSDVVTCNYYIVDNNSCDFIQAFNNTIEEYDKRFLVANPSPCNKLIKKQLFMDNLSFPAGLYYEDLGTIPLIPLYTDKFSFIDESLYYYLKHDSSIMNQSKYNKKMESIFNILEKIYNEYNDKAKIEQYSEEIEYLYIHHLLRAAGVRFISYSEGICHIKKINMIMKEKFPNWRKNKYYKKYCIKQKVMCNLIYMEKYKIIKFLRRL